MITCKYQVTVSYSLSGQIIRSAPSFRIVVQCLNITLGSGCLCRTLLVLWCNDQPAAHRWRTPPPVVNRWVWWIWLFRFWLVCGAFGVSMVFFKGCFNGTTILWSFYDVLEACFFLVCAFLCHRVFQFLNISCSVFVTIPTNLAGDAYWIW